MNGSPFHGPYDNAYIKSWHAQLERECLRLQEFTAFAEVYAAVMLAECTQIVNCLFRKFYILHDGTQLWPECSSGEMPPTDLTLTVSEIFAAYHHDKPRVEDAFRTQKAPDLIRIPAYPAWD